MKIPHGVNQITAKEAIKELWIGSRKQKRVYVDVNGTLYLAFAAVEHNTSILFDNPDSLTYTSSYKIPITPKTKFYIQL